MRHRAPRPARSARSARRWAWLTVSLAGLALACFGFAIASPRAGSLMGAATAQQRPASPATVPASPTPTATPTPGPTAHTGAAGVPVRITIPAIDVTAGVDLLGLEPDRTVEVPEDPMRTGWYRLGPRPGQPGSAVVLGHVDSIAGSAVFARLRDLRVGDLVVVEAADGLSSTFRVDRLSTYANAEFPAEDVYAAPGPEARLNLVTCGGRYTPETGHQANLVVYTRLVPPTQPPG